MPYYFEFVSWMLCYFTSRLALFVIYHRRDLGIYCSTVNHLPTFVCPAVSVLLCPAVFLCCRLCQSQHTNPPLLNAFSISYHLSHVSPSTPELTNHFIYRPVASPHAPPTVAALTNNHNPPLQSTPHHYNKKCLKANPPIPQDKPSTRI